MTTRINSDAPQDVDAFPREALQLPRNAQRTRSQPVTIPVSTPKRGWDSESVSPIKRALKELDYSPRTSFDTPVTPPRLPKILGEMNDAMTELAEPSRRICILNVIESVEALAPRKP